MLAYVQVWQHDIDAEETESVEEPLWTPSPARVADANVTRFRRQIEADWGVELDDYAALHRYSIDHLDEFWISLWDFAGVIAAERGDRVVADADRMPGARFFPDARLNFAQNLLRRRDESDAMVFWGEDRVRRRLSHAELYDEVSRCVEALREAGVGVGDRVAAWLPNMPETYIVMLAAASIGALFSSTSPDFGTRGVLDRLSQIEPKVLVAADGYVYNGREHDCLERLAEIRAGLPSLERTVVVPYTGTALDVVSGGGSVHDICSWRDFVGSQPANTIEFVQLPFTHPLYILFSSGTTGPPKCIVHAGAGVLLKHLAEHQLQCDIRAGDRVFYFTTAGWMMWNWLASTLASEATLLLYDGAPTYPQPDSLFDLADAEAMALFGTSAKFIDALGKAGRAPIETHDLDALRTITSTGSPLSHEGFDYVYSRVKADVHLASISGGTDICGCFVAGDPTSPVWRGEIQRPALGMAVDVFDEAGRPMPAGKGELVCTRPFPSLPVEFWNDPGGTKYRSAYFDRFPNVWHHGDYMSWTAHGGAVIYGRSDATLNPGGVRIGTAEIYRQVDQMDEVLESIVVGQEFGNDTRIVLFVRLADDRELDRELVERIKRRIRKHCTPRHVPAQILAVADIPRTRSGKITELAVTDVIHGREIDNTEALANPEALALFAALVPELDPQAD